MSELHDMASPYPEKTELLGLPCHLISAEDVCAYIEKVVLEKKQAIIFYLNVHGTVLATRFRWFHDFFQKAQLVLCDGEGIRLGLKILKRPVPEKIPITRWIYPLSDFCAKKNLQMYLLGAPQHIVTCARKVLEQSFPSLKIVGHHHGYFDKEGPENETVLQAISSAKPDIVLVGFGMPLQEKWIFENHHRLQVPVFITVGGLFDYVSGRLGKAPQWMIRWGLEWLFRVWEEPRRLFMRYATDIPLFFLLIFKERFLKKKSNAPTKKI